MSEESESQKEIEVAPAKKHRKPGAGRKKKENTLWKEANEVLLQSLPDAARALIASAIGTRDCPHCGKPVTVVKDVRSLQILVEQLRGKPTQKSEIDMTARVDLQNADLIKISMNVMVQINYYQSLPTAELEAHIKALAVKPDTAMVPVP